MFHGTMVGAVYLCTSLRSQSVIFTMTLKHKTLELPPVYKKKRKKNNEHQYSSQSLLMFDVSMNIYQCFDVAVKND